MNFPNLTDKEFEEKFMHMISKSRKDSTYKFAFARFLLEYSNQDNPKTHIKFSTIAEYFLKYFWPQVCKTKLKHSKRVLNQQGKETKPEIITIIEGEFSEPYYPKAYNYFKKKELQKNTNCIDKIKRKCFHDVTWRFQKINNTETNFFFDYRIKSKQNENRKTVDLEYGINLNPYAIKFLKKHYAVLDKVVILEWTRFLEKFNLEVAKIIPKIEGSKIKRDATYVKKAKKELQKWIKKCFYCKNTLTQKETQLEHVIPFDYISEDNIWNFTLACKTCNCKKLGALPEENFLDDLIRQNEDFRNKISMLEESLRNIGDDFKEYIENRYRNAQKFGYLPKPMP